MIVRPRAMTGVVLLALVTTSLALAAPGYYRYPHISGDRIVFAAEGDLWTVSDQGGLARRITSYPGTEYFPRFSPDGKTIAFTGEYDGNRDVFVIPAEGGEPRRLTWHPGADEVVGWMPDGKRVLFRSGRENPLEWELFAVSTAGGDPDKLPIGWANRIDVDPQTGMWAFTRKSWETATWKRYRGGTAPDIWVGDPRKADFKLATTFPGTNAFPMWNGGRIYFLSDQGGTANIWSMKPDGSDRRRHTERADWDVRWPAMGPDGRIVFSLGADLHVFSPADGKVRKLEVDLPSERYLTRTRYTDPGRFLTWFTVSPKGDRVEVTTRGEMFSVAVKDGATLPVTRRSGARESWGDYSLDGKKLVYVTDAPGEEEIRVIDAWGRGEPTVVKPAGDSGWHFPPQFSPDGKWIAYADQKQALYVLPATGGTPKLVDRSPQSEIRTYTWSPDGRWLAYSKIQSPTDYSSVYIYDTRGGISHRVTGPYTDDFGPSWDPEGRYLYFLSNRATNPVLDGRDLQNVEIKNTIPMMVLLRKDVKNPFAPLNGLPDDEAAAKKDDGAKDKAAAEKSGKKKDTSSAKKDEDEAKDDKAKEDEPPKPIEIDVEGLGERLLGLPDVPRGRYVQIAATAKRVYMLEGALSGMAEEPGLFGEPEPDGKILGYDLEKKKLAPFADGVSAFEIARKADKIALMKRRGDIYVVDAGAKADLEDAKVSLDGIVVSLDPRAEWKQMYFEGWRHQRDFFWDEGMGGLDWKKVRDQYGTLLSRLGTRDDLRDLLGELIGELNNSHTYVFGGDPGVRPPQVATGLLGADLEREGAAYKVVRIYRGDPADNVRSPLSEPGVMVKEGDYILAVNHAPFPAGMPFDAALENLADKDVLLTVGPKPTPEASRDVVVRTMRSDDELRYADWVRENREYVAFKTGGKIGYVHLPNMGREGQIAFNTWFYPQLDKEGMIVDCRWNGGGFVSQMILERFRRKIVSFDRSRGGGINSYPYRTLNGPFVVLTNEFAGSDGDIFPAAVQLEKLAPVIGMRSWGGVVGIRGDKRLVDGGFLTEPEFAWYDPKSGWTIENHGVQPDIEVQNLPQDVATGKDAQLERGIAEVLNLHEKNPPIVPKWAPVRPRGRDAFRDELTAAPAGSAGTASGAR
ncbi:MAG: PD40 domain-containing protein [Acidobacteria bacterium]|nr:PD40 domain-containing protein [Acidobacteriota bacterium]